MTANEVKSARLLLIYSVVIQPNRFTSILKNNIDLFDESNSNFFNKNHTYIFDI